MTTFNAPLIGPTGVATGSVSFYLNGASTPFDTEPVNDSGVAISTTGTLPVGSDQITAIYTPVPGSAYQTSTSNTLD